METVHSVCQSCHIILVEGNSNGNGDLGTAENTAVRLGANEVSNSYGEPEAGSAAAYQADFNHPGNRDHRLGGRRRLLLLRRL